MQNWKKQKVSLFDLDKTLLNANSSYCFGLYLFKQKQFPLFALLRSAGLYSLNNFGFLSISQLHLSIFNILFVRQPAALIESLAQTFVSEQFENLLNFTVCTQLEKAKQEGQYTVILSSSPSFLVKHFAEKFGVSEWSSTEFQIDIQGKYEKISHLMLGSDKAKYVENLSKKLGFPNELMTAYSDSFEDLHFLQAVGEAIAVNPDRRLRKHSQKVGWPVI